MRSKKREIAKIIEDVIEPFPLRRRSPLSRSHPEVAAWWCYEKNCGFTPGDFSYGSKIKVWWQCAANKAHIFRQSVKVRVRMEDSRTRGCAFCSSKKVCPSNSLQSRFPALVKEWHPLLNKLKPSEVVYGSHSIFWWRCKKGHEWKATVKTRTAGRGCPHCHGKPTDLSKFPEALACFDRRRNRNVDPLALPRRSKVFWICRKNKNHRWEGWFDSAKKELCPHCTGAAPTDPVTLESNAKLSREFHRTKNGKLKPKHLSLWSHRRVWWKCVKGPDHEWQASVKDRFNDDTGCPFCANRRLSVTNTLKLLAPQVLDEWHAARNHPATPETVVATSMVKYWWKCKRGHEWQQRPFHRTNYGSGCAKCYLSRGKGKAREG